MHLALLVLDSLEIFNIGKLTEHVAELLRERYHMHSFKLIPSMHAGSAERAGSGAGAKLKTQQTDGFRCGVYTAMNTASVLHHLLDSQPPFDCSDPAAHTVIKQQADQAIAQVMQVLVDEARAKFG